VRKGNKKQEHHFQSNVRALNANLAVLTTAGDALLTARRDGLDPFDVVFNAVGGESQLAATVESAKKLIRPLDLDSRDLIQTQYAFVRGALLALYEALDVRAVRGTDPAPQALAYIQQLDARGRRVTARRSRPRRPASTPDRLGLAAGRGPAGLTDSAAGALTARPRGAERRLFAHLSLLHLDSQAPAGPRPSAPSATGWSSTAPRTA